MFSFTSDFQQTVLDYLYDWKLKTVSELPLERRHVEKFSTNDKQLHSERKTCKSLPSVFIPHSDHTNSYSMKTNSKKNSMNRSVPIIPTNKTEAHKEHLPYHRSSLQLNFYQNKLNVNVFDPPKSTAQIKAVKVGSFVFHIHLPSFRIIVHDNIQRTLISFESFLVLLHHYVLMSCQYQFKHIHTYKSEKS